MAVQRKYGDKPLQVVVEDETKERIEKLAEIEQVSQASIIRDFVHAGLPAREKKAGITRG